MRHDGWLPYPRSDHRFLAWLVVVAGCLASCSRSSETAEYGEAVELRLSGAPNEPSFRVAVAVTRGRDIRPLVNELASHIYRAAKSCPAVATEVRSGNAVTVHFSIDGDQLQATNSAIDQQPGACVLQELQKRSMVAPTEKVDVLAGIRAVEP